MSVFKSAAVEERIIKLKEAGKPYRFKKGDYSIRRGRPSKIKNLTKLLESHLNEYAYTVPFVNEMCEELGLDPQKTMIGAVLVLSNIVEAMKGNAVINKDIWQRMDGIVTFEAVAKDGDKPVRISFSDIEKRVKRAIEMQNENITCEQ